MDETFKYLQMAKLKKPQVSNEKPRERKISSSVKKTVVKDMIDYTQWDGMGADAAERFSKVTSDLRHSYVSFRHFLRINLYHMTDDSSSFDYNLVFKVPPTSSKFFVSNTVKFVSLVGGRHFKEVNKK